MFIVRTDAEAATPIPWPPDRKNWLLAKDPDAGKDWMQKEKGTTEDELVGLHHWLNGNEFEQAPGVGGGQGSLACCSPWGCKESDMTEWLNLTELGVNHSSSAACISNMNLRVLQIVWGRSKLRDWAMQLNFFRFTCMMLYTDIINSLQSLTKWSPFKWLKLLEGKRETNERQFLKYQDFQEKIQAV